MSYTTNDDQVNVYYENKECPDCGKLIPDKAQEGDECLNCGHVFWLYKNVD